MLVVKTLPLMFLWYITAVVVLTASGFSQTAGPTPEQFTEKNSAAKQFIEQANRCETANARCRIAAFTKAIETAPTFAEGYYGRAITYRAAGDNAKAKTAFETLKKTADAEAGPGSGFAQRAEQMLDRLGN